MSIQFVLFLVLHLICTGVPQTILTVTTDPICPNGPVEFTCTVHNVIALRWLVDNNVQVTYMSDGSSTNTPVEGIQPSLGTIQPDGTEFDFNSTLIVSDASVLVGREVICDGGGPTTAESQTLEFNSPPVPPEFNCNLPGQRILRLEWINMNTDDSVDEYRACSCIGGGCPCVPTACGDLSNNCVMEFEADQVHNFMFTAVNCGSQESNASVLTVDARAEPPPIKVSAWYNQFTRDLCNIAVTWDTVAPISVPVGCVEGIAQQYNVRCGDNFERLGLLQSTICNGDMCQFESPASTGCTLSVDSVNVMGTRTMNQNIPELTPLIVAVSSGRHMTCNIICNISYGIDPNLEFLPNTNTSGPAGVELTQLVEGEENFYVVSADIGSLTVKVKGSRDLRIETQCDCSELVSEPVGTCQDNGTLSIPNGIVTYESVSVGSEALYQCKDGFSLSGVSNRTCQGNGSWSGSQPVCRKEMNIAAIVGIVVGGVVGLLLILVLVILILVLEYKYKYGYKHYPCEGNDAPQRIELENGSSSVEYKKLKKASDTVIENLAGSRMAEDLAQKMFAKGFISRGIRDKATIYAPDVTEEDRIRKIIDAVLLKVEEDSDNYSKFLRILKEFPDLDDVVEYIENTCVEYTEQESITEL